MSAQSRPGSTVPGTSSSSDTLLDSDHRSWWKIFCHPKIFCKLKIVDHLAEVESWLEPLHAEVEAEGDGVVLVVDGQHVGDLET